MAYGDDYGAFGPIITPFGLKAGGVLRGGVEMGLFYRVMWGFLSIITK